LAVNRREFGAAALGAAVVGAAAAGSAEEPKPETSSGRLAFAAGRLIEFRVVPPGVEWGGGTSYPLQLGGIEFSLGREAGTLTAEVRGMENTFVEMRYDVSAAVFDEGGRPLGAARSVCEVPEFFKGASLTRGKTIPLDFGTSLDFVKAKTFEVAVSNRRVLTPDRWRRG
jgi:hypothetical protein